MNLSIRVWAPLPKKVELQWDGGRMPMNSAPDGWWSAENLNGTRAMDYGFILDGEGPFPDPRSPCQPNGIDGLSRTVDHASFTWTDGAFKAPPLSSAIFYELHTGTFTPDGTFDAIIGKLDHLVALGVTHVELMPVNEFSGNCGWGYDGVDLFAPHHAYGVPDGLKRLVNACHGRGLAVILDVVYNHLGPVGNYLGKFGPYFTKKHTSPWGPALNFDDADSAEVRRFFCDNALMWLRDYHFDGLRLDAVHAILDTSATPFLEQLAAEVRQLEAGLNRPLVLVAESDLNDPRLISPPERGGFNLPAQWSDDFHHALHAVLTGEQNGYYADFGSLEKLAKAIRNAYVYDGDYSKFRKRPHGRPPSNLDGHHFLAYLQNHDQTGNRAKGDRSSHLMNPQRLKVGAALVLTSPFVPMLFQGEEWGAKTPFQYFTDHQDPKMGEMVRKGRRQEFAAQGWNPDEIPDPQDPETFQRSKLNWSELSQPSHGELLEWFKKLIALRRKEPALRDGRREETNPKFSEQEGWLAFERGPLVVACNIGKETRTVPLPDGKWEVALASAIVSKSAQGSLALPPDSVVILRQV